MKTNEILLKEFEERRKHSIEERLDYIRNQRLPESES